MIFSLKSVTTTGWPLKKKKNATVTSKGTPCRTQGAILNAISPGESSSGHPLFFFSHRTIWYLTIYKAYYYNKKKKLYLLHPFFFCHWTAWYLITCHYYNDKKKLYLLHPWSLFLYIPDFYPVVGVFFFLALPFEKMSLKRIGGFDTFFCWHYH